MRIVLKFPAIDEIDSLSLDGQEFLWSGYRRKKKGVKKVRPTSTWETISISTFSLDAMASAGAGAIIMAGWLARKRDGGSLSQEQGNIINGNHGNKNSYPDSKRNGQKKRKEMLDVLVLFWLGDTCGFQTVGSTGHTPSTRDLLVHNSSLPFFIWFFPLFQKRRNGNKRWRKRGRRRCCPRELSVHRVLFFFSRIHTNRMALASSHPTLPNTFDIFPPQKIYVFPTELKRKRFQTVKTLSSHW